MAPMARAQAANRGVDRLGADARRTSLLDVARSLVEDGGPDNVTMGSVAERAEVTRALVYKHFANRGDILGALYRREAAVLDDAIRRRVTAAPEGFQPKLRAFVGAALEAAATHARFFDALRSHGQDSAFRQGRRTWDRRTIGYFAGLAAAEHDLDRRRARTAVAVLLPGVTALVEQSRADPGPEARAELEDLYVELVVGGLRHLSDTDG
jgi:AcrR family transcriptional regulator